MKRILLLEDDLSLGETIKELLLENDYEVFLLVKIFKDNKKVHKNSEDESLQILKNRFARGDITEEEYSSKKSILNL